MAAHPTPDSKAPQGPGNPKNMRTHSYKPGGQKVPGAVKGSKG